MTKPEELANQIRTLLRDVDAKVLALRAHGFKVDIVYEAGVEHKLKASKTMETHL